MKKILCWLCLGAIVSLPTTSAAAAERRLPLIVKSRYFKIYGDRGIDIYTLLTKLNFNYLLQLDTLDRPRERDLSGLLARTMDALFQEVSDVLNVNVRRFHADIKFYEDQAALAAAVADIFHPGFKEESFYHREANAIYIAYADLTLERLGSEIADAILSHYFVVPPPARVQEVLSGYVSYHLQKAAAVIPEE